MCREAKDRIVKEIAAPLDINPAIDHLSHELSCLFDPGAGCRGTP